MSGTGLRLAFAGTPELAVTVLRSLIEQSIHNVLYVYTQPDRPAGRGRKTRQSPVKQLAQNNCLTLRQPQTRQDIDNANELSNIDVLIVVAYGMIIPESILSRPNYGCINVHMSLLPRWRGAAPIQRAIAAGDKDTGVTIMQMDAGLDTGDILLQRACSILETDTAASLQNRLALLGAECLQEILNSLNKGNIKPRRQDNEQATYAHKLTKDEAIIDWTQSAATLSRMIRAFNPAPIARTELNGIKMRIWEADVINSDTNNKAAGTIMTVSKDGIVVATGEGCLNIRKLQLPGKKIISVQDFLNARPDFAASLS